jgi:hypothetical protein
MLATVASESKHAHTVHCLANQQSPRRPVFAGNSWINFVAASAISVRVSIRLSRNFRFSGGGLVTCRTAAKGPKVQLQMSLHYACHCH